MARMEHFSGLPSIGGAECPEELLECVRLQANAVRALKESGATQEELTDAVWKLLHFKFLYCQNSSEPVTQPDLFVRTTPPPKIKIRWYTAHPVGERGQRNEVIRHQRVFSGQSFVPGVQVLRCITSYMSRKFGLRPGIALLEVEHREEVSMDGEDESTEVSKWAKKKRRMRSDVPVVKSYSAIATTVQCESSSEDKLKLPLVTPGPLLAEECVYNIRVTFLPVVPPSISTPAAYSTLASLPMLIDCGVNLFDEQLPRTREIITRAHESGVQQMALLSTTIENSRWNIELCAYRAGSLFSTVGIHPLEAAKMPVDQMPGIIKELRDLVLKNKQHVYAIGECGLDFSEADESREVQVAWLQSQLQLAVELNLPVVLHERDAFEAFYEILGNVRSVDEQFMESGVSQAKQQKVLPPRILINCFTGNREQLQKYVALGAYIGVTGIIAHERGAHLLEILSDIPLDRVVIGTDAPYMKPFNMPPPLPRCNEPAYLPFVLVKLSEILRMNVEQLANTTTENCRRLYGLRTLVHSNSVGFRTSIIGTEIPYRTNPVHYYGPKHPFAKEKSSSASGTESEGTAECSSSNSLEQSEVTVNSKDASVVDPSGEQQEEQAAASALAPSAGDDLLLFGWDGQFYMCTPKEHAILTRQKTRLDREAFAELLRDFDLNPLQGRDS